MIRALALLSTMTLLAMCGGSSGGGRDVAFDGALPSGVGPVCGNSAILGQRVARISGDGACGIAQPVKLYAVSGVRLSAQPVVNCGTARALRTWIAKGARPAVDSIGQELESLRVVAHYVCRRRNHQAGAKISEHGKGNAIDIGGLGLANGDYISVENDWGRGAKGRALRQMRRAACGPFGVVLGPGSDRWHDDHFHFDISNLSRPYCK